ncbi:GATA zinc finger domain-containing protein 14-like [Artemia franciscana]|uniref:BHLH domain-containing protein n=1 Tax=Artemia franciscana TaxID=6661 RepID=A0AA88KTE4_ARTSF|nr:hypothetical protein QYM36_016106 [Artemia franciscana]
MRPLVKTREWEKQRRDRLNEGFSCLSKEIPELATAENVSKLKILQTAVTYIQRLRSLISESTQEGGQGFGKCNCPNILKNDKGIQVDVRAILNHERDSSVKRFVRSEPGLRPLRNDNAQIIVNTPSASVVILSSSEQSKIPMGRQIFPKFMLQHSKVSPSKTPRLPIKRKLSISRSSKPSKKRKTSTSKTNLQGNMTDKSVSTPLVLKEKASQPDASDNNATKNDVPEHNFSISNVLQQEPSKSQNSAPNEVSAETNQTDEVPNDPNHQPVEAVSTKSEVTTSNQSIYTYPSCYYASSKPESTYLAQTYSNYYDTSFNGYPGYPCDNTNFLNYTNVCNVNSNNGTEFSKDRVVDNRSAEARKSAEQLPIEPPIAMSTVRNSNDKEPHITELVNATPASISRNVVENFKANPDNAQQTARLVDKFSGSDQQDKKSAASNKEKMQLNIREVHDAIPQVVTQKMDTNTGSVLGANNQKTSLCQANMISHAIGNLLEKTTNQSAEALGKSRSNIDDTKYVSTTNKKSDSTAQDTNQQSFNVKEQENANLCNYYASNRVEDSNAFSNSVKQQGISSAHKSASDYQTSNSIGLDFPYGGFHNYAQQDISNARVLHFDAKCQKSQRILSVSQLVEQPKNRDNNLKTGTDKQDKHSLTGSSAFLGNIPPKTAIPQTNLKPTLPVTTATVTTVSSNSYTRPENHLKQGYSDSDRNRSYKSYTRGYCAYSAEALINQDYTGSEQFRSQQNYSQWHNNQQYFHNTGQNYNKTQGFNDNSNYQQFQFSDQAFYPSPHQIGNFHQDLSNMPSFEAAGDTSTFFQYDSNRSNCGDKSKTKEQNTRSSDQHLNNYYADSSTTMTVPLPSFSSILDDVSFANSGLNQTEQKPSKVKPSSSKPEKSVSSQTAVTWSNSMSTITFSGDDSKKNKKESKQNNSNSKKSTGSWNTFGQAYQSAGTSNFNMSNIIPEIRYSNPARPSHEVGNFQFNADYGVSFPSELPSGYVTHQNIHMGHSIPPNFKPMDFNFPSVVPSAASFTVPHASVNFKQSKQ